MAHEHQQSDFGQHMKTEKTGLGKLSGQTKPNVMPRGGSISFRDKDQGSVYIQDIKHFVD